MTDIDLFLICPTCGTKISISYAETTHRPTSLDEGRTLYVCPVCGAHLIRVINPTFNEKWDLENEVNYAASQREKLLKMTDAFTKSNREKLKGFAEPAQEPQTEESA